MAPTCKNRPGTGFSLVEILVAIALIGILGIFTIPKLLNPPGASANSKYNAIAKDAAYMIHAAYEQYRLSNTSVPSNISAAALTPYMNYVKITTDGSNLVDPHPPSSVNGRVCNAGNPCLHLHNGSILHAFHETFNGTNTTNTIQFRLDPDGVKTGQYDSIQFQLYYNGVLRTRGKAFSNSCHSSSCGWGSNSSYDPSWFGGF